MQLKMLVSHEGEEFMDTVEGIHKFIYNNKKCILNEGDSIYFDSRIPHTGRSIGKQRANILAGMYSCPTSVTYEWIQSNPESG
jgi:mannose-6-phosphate isomerase-like protein (cupin superfamily)